MLNHLNISFGLNIFNQNQRSSYHNPLQTRLKSTFKANEKLFNYIYSKLIYLQYEYNYSVQDTCAYSCL